MKAYGFKGQMNPQTKMKKNMNPSMPKGKMEKDEYPGLNKGSNDMSPKYKKSSEQAVWQNMR